MTTNMGSTDRVIRAILGAVLLIAAFTAISSTLWTAIAAIVGLAMLGTAAMGYCPPYQLFGIKTCKIDKV
ncbi:Protein of unknown function (DUF2892) [Aliiruegeria haliotis]|uniref:Inner membrane protein YgaP-like transmembrane domain-containing protein n=1 Tax=Aliiruegeria haliotis TaxID=1280846 RepID=A0A2T0RPV3_9RHOB|nr:DUF2892 domain-containing protein [Aliiruegeria haliotis]PRY23216.1 Protein of unknown function (DUF2892) [Aliiruegeria haliotis]